MAPQIGRPRAGHMRGVASQQGLDLPCAAALSSDLGKSDTLRNSFDDLLLVLGEP